MSIVFDFTILLPPSIRNSFIRTRGWLRKASSLIFTGLGSTGRFSYFNKLNSLTF